MTLSAVWGQAKYTDIPRRATLSLSSPESVNEAMRSLILEGFAALPFPGEGQTRKRWHMLAQVGAANLALAKIFESHTDALAIAAELDRPLDSSRLHAVWAAEHPHHPLIFDEARHVLDGTKFWCSGAAFVDSALVTACTESGENLLIEVEIDPLTAEVVPAWETEAMRPAGTSTVHFRRALARKLGDAGAYLQRPGFWHGGGGIAAIWLGAAGAVANRLGQDVNLEAPHALAHLGAVDAVLSAANALLERTANWIDDHPRADAFVPVMRLRTVVEQAATEVLDRSGRALGPGPLCLDTEHARRCADLRLFLRQSHGEKDLAALGKAVARGNFA